MSTPKRRRPIRWLTGLLVTVTLLIGFAPTTVGGVTSYVIVSGSSMEPTLAEGDLVVVRRGDYRVGDIVAFESGNGLVIHRIVGGSAKAGFRMQGDNKEAPDTWTPTPDDIVGKHFARVPEAGTWVAGLASSPALLGALIGGLGSLMIWSPQRRRRRHGAHSADAPRSRAPKSDALGVPPRGAGPTLAALAVVGLLLGAALVWLLMRPLERVESVERVLYEHEGTFAYTASVEDSVVYDSETVASPGSGSEPTAIYAHLLEELLVEFRYDTASPEPSHRGTISAELHIAAGEGVWTRTIELLPIEEFEGSTLVTFPVDIAQISRMLSRAEEETGFDPGTYQVTVVADIRVVTEGESRVGVFEARLPMELSETLLSINNEELTTSGASTVIEEAAVPNDIDLFRLTVPTRWARAGAGGLLAIVILGGSVYAFVVRRRVGKGELARIRLRYGSLIVPVTGTSQNGAHPVDVGSMADLARLARRAEQMVFHDQGSGRFFVPDGPVTYQYRLSNADRGEA